MSSNNEEGVNVNPFAIFLLLFITPYLLFYALLVLITGEVSLAILYNAVSSEDNTALLKTWIIGSFLLSIVGTAVISGASISRSIKRKISVQNRHSGLSKSDPHFVIERDDKE